MASNTHCVEKAKYLLKRQAVVFLQICPARTDDTLTVTRELESLGCLVAKRGDQVIAFPRGDTIRSLAADDYSFAIGWMA